MNLTSLSNKGMQSGHFVHSKTNINTKSTIAIENSVVKVFYLCILYNIFLVESVITKFIETLECLHGLSLPLTILTL